VFEEPALTLVRDYVGTAEQARTMFELEQPALAEAGYQALDRHFESGRWSRRTVVLAVLLAPVVVGIVMLVYLGLTSPPGRLRVRFEFIAPQRKPEPPLVRPGAIDQSLSRIAAALGEDGRVAAESFRSSLIDTVRFLESTADDAHRSLKGEAAAVIRLRFLLSRQSGTAPAGGSSLAQHAGGRVPRAVDEDRFAVVVAGVTWAASSAAEAAIMLAALAEAVLPLQAIDVTSDATDLSATTARALLATCGVVIALPGSGEPVPDSNQASDAGNVGQVAAFAALAAPAEAELIGPVGPIGVGPLGGLVNPSGFGPHLGGIPFVPPSWLTVLIRTPFFPPRPAPGDEPWDSRPRHCCVKRSDDLDAGTLTVSSRGGVVEPSIQEDEPQISSISRTWNAAQPNYFRRQDHGIG
jgi:hypothetical protein